MTELVDHTEIEEMIVGSSEDDDRLEEDTVDEYIEDDYRHGLIIKCFLIQIIALLSHLCEVFLNQKRFWLNTFVYLILLF